MVNTAGTWSFTPDTNLSEGTHQAEATATDGVGNESEHSQARSFNIDIHPPTAPVVLTPANSLTINNNRPTYRGTAEAYSTVTVFVGDEEVGSTTANHSGDWTIQQPAALVLADGDHWVRARAMDIAGNLGDTSSTNTFTVDTTPPAAPVMLTPTNSLITNNNRPIYSGTAEANSTITLFVDEVEVGSPTANPLGAWSFPQPADLLDGSHTVRVRATDVVGNVSHPFQISLMVDTKPPAAPEVTAPGATVNTQQPAIGGTAEAGSLVTVWLDDTEEGLAVANAAGAWHFPLKTALGEGAHQIKATAQDAAGNTSPSSADHSFVILIPRSHYGWSCTTAPAFPATWALLTLAWALRGRRLSRPRPMGRSVPKER